MTYHLIALSFFLACCGAQEHLTCLRTDSVTAPLPPAQIGRPGRRGAPGPVGLKGSKGEAGIPDNYLVESLKGKKLKLYRSLILYLCTDVALH